MNLKKIFQQTGWQLVGKAVTSVCTLLTLGIVARRYGELGMGEFTLALTLLAFFNLAIDAGINAHLLPYFIKENFGNNFRKLFGLRLTLSILVAVLAVIIILVWPGQDLNFKQISLLGLFSIFETAIFVSVNAIFQAKLRYDLLTLVVSAGSILTLVVVYLISRAGSVNQIMWGYILGWLLMTGLSLWLVRKFVKSSSPIFDFHYISKTIRDSWLISITLVLNVIYFRLDAFLIAYFKGFNEVGIYNLAYSVFQSVLVLPTFIMNAVYPMLVKELASDKQSFLRSLRRLTVGLGILGGLGLLGGYLLAPEVISLISGGKGFIGSVISLQILVVSLPAFFMSSVLMWVLVTLRKYKKMTAIYMTGLVVNAVLNFLLIPRYSYIAAAWVTGISEYLILSLQVVMLLKLLKKSIKID